MDCKQRLLEEMDSDSEDLPYPKSLMVTPQRLFYAGGRREVHDAISNSKGASMDLDRAKRDKGKGIGHGDRNSQDGSPQISANSTPAKDREGNSSLNFKKDLITDLGEDINS